MTRSLKGIVACAAFALSSASAAAPCGVGTLANYIALGSCEIGATSFAGFELVLPLPASATEIPAAAIAVTPIVSATNPGLLFAFTAAAGGGDLLAALFRFQVVAALGTSLTRADQSLAGAAATGDGVALLVSNLCFDGQFAAPPSLCGGSGEETMISFTDNVLGGEPDAFVLLSALDSLDVVVNFIIDGGLFGSATTSGGSLRFLTDAAPPRVAEPPLLALLAFLPVAWVVARRAQRPRG